MDRFHHPVGQTLGMMMTCITMSVCVSHNGGATFHVDLTYLGRNIGGKIGVVCRVV
jgi:hypothetical protein